MYDRRRYLGAFAVFALVLLRLVIGWHFLREGAKKVEYDRRTGELRLAFTSEGFLKEAKGPLAGWYHSQAPDDHGFRELLAVPRQNVPQAADSEEVQRAPETKKGEPAPIAFPAGAPYYDWASRIADDWRATLEAFKSIPAVTDQQHQLAEQRLAERLRQVANYLAGQSEAITEYRHELWRLENWRDAPESGEVPFYDQRIAVKTTETAAPPTAWINQIRSLEADFHNDLRGLLNTEQRDQALTTAAVKKTLTDPRERRLHIVDIIVTALTIGVGVCLLLGFFTRLASELGALFLLAVIASQPPWLADTVPTMPNVIEFAALLVLAGTGAGRWMGLDFFTYALLNRMRRRTAVRV